MFSLVTAQSRSCGSPLTNNAGTVIVTTSPIRLWTKYVLRHVCVDYMLSPPSAVSIMVSFHLFLQLVSEQVIV